MKNLLIILAALILFGCSSGNTESNTMPETPPIKQNSFAYITEHRIDIKVCELKDDNQLGKCRILDIENVNPKNIIGVTVHPNKEIAYLSDQVNNLVYYCNINPTTGDLSNCLPTGSTWLFKKPRPITISADGLTAYVANDSLTFASVVVCGIYQLTFELRNCKESVKQDPESSLLSMSPTSIAINSINNNLIISLLNESPAICSVNDEMVTNCNQLATQYNGFAITVDTAISNKYLYVTNYGASFVSICNINQTSGSIENCFDSIDIIDGSLFGSYAIKLSDNKDFAYVSSITRGIVSFCPINESNGQFTNCAQTGESFVYPTSIALREAPKDLVKVLR